MAALTVGKSDFNETISEGVSLVDFWAPWCGPCKTQGPIVDEIATELSGKAKIAKLNVDDHGEIAGQFGISSIPTLMVFKDGQPVEKMVGLQSKDSLVSKIEKHL